MAGGACVYTLQITWREQYTRNYIFYICAALHSLRLCLTAR